MKNKIFYHKEWCNNNREKLREYNKKYNKVWREKNGYHNEENSKKKYPEKLRARQLLQYAVKSGRMKRGNCEICGKESAQAHHEDYSKPLDVRWFCPLHHREFDTKLSTVTDLQTN